MGEQDQHYQPATTV